LPNVTTTFGSASNTTSTGFWSVGNTSGAATSLAIDDSLADQTQLEIDKKIISDLVKAPTKTGMKIVPIPGDIPIATHPDGTPITD